MGLILSVFIFVVIYSIWLSILVIAVPVVSVVIMIVVHSSSTGFYEVISSSLVKVLSISNGVRVLGLV